MSNAVTMTMLVAWINERLDEKASENNGGVFKTWVENNTLEYNDDEQTGVCAVCAWGNGDYLVKDLEPMTEARSEWWANSTSYWGNRSIKDALDYTFAWRWGDDVSDPILVIYDDEGQTHDRVFDDTIKRSLEGLVNTYASSRWLSKVTETVEIRPCIDHAMVCQVCESGYVYPIALASWVHSESLCFDCSDHNAWCGSGDHWTSDGTWYIGGQERCADCAYDDGYAQCENCNEWYRDGYHCEDCDYDEPNGSIHSYQYKPDPEFGWVEEVDGDLSVRSARRGVVFMGLEIEVECKSGSISDGVDVLHRVFGDNENYLYLKTDGSINHGFEIVTHPRTLASHKSMRLQGFKELADAGFRGWNTQTCGIHVHVNRDGFNGVPHQWRWTRLFATNQNQLTLLAGRSSERWATFSDMKRKLSYAFKHQSGYGDNRYEAINLTNHYTFEVRIFKSSLNPERIAMIMELIDATVEYTRNLTVRQISDHGLEWDRFIDWVVSEQSVKYPNLIAYCEKHGISSKQLTVF